MNQSSVSIICICKSFLPPKVRNLRPLASPAPSLHDAPSLHHQSPSPICLSEVIRKPFTLSQVFLLSSGGKSAFS
ncbi:hypothetical protein HMPREF3185_01232 [Porphyromonas somerae]|uniref:Uncharacterized protein n=1 Tax=Porphyromonas somerae TaxID=322095 RepID=A0A134B7S5_9PORP|nr:hypothetical protein HMPREF3184_01232 [Porphyromonadaceae bacterium KA00676]KXB75983.1 hypothetical protein HMPREF3185_01232 [Porphyromonas somerae]